MKKKNLICAFLLLVFLIVFSVPAGAVTADDIIDQQKQQYGWDSLEKSVPGEVYDNAEDFGSDFSVENLEQFLNIKGRCV